MILRRQGGCEPKTPSDTGKNGETKTPNVCGHALFGKSGEPKTPWQCLCARQNITIKVKKIL